MTKKEEEMKAILQRLDQQDKILAEVLMLLKGSESLEIEGVMPVQKRILKELDMIMKWKEEITLYITILTSKKTWKVLLWISIVFGLIIVWAKFGFDYVIDGVKLLFK